MNQIIKATIQQAFEKNKKELERIGRNTEIYAGELEFASEQYASAVKLAAEINAQQEELTKFLNQEDGDTQQAQMPAQDAVEAEIQAKGSNVAPSVKPAEIEAQIAIEYHFNLFEATVANESGPCGEFAKGLSAKEINTLEARMQCIDQCVLILRNGYVVTGESACASAEIYDRKKGQENARANAVSKIWPFMGYELRSKLATAS